MPNVIPARTERSVLIGALLRVRAFVYLLAGIPLIVAPDAEPEAQVFGVVAVVIAGATPVVASRMGRWSTVRFSALADLVVSFGLWFVAPSASGISLLLAMWAIAFAVLLDSRKNARIVAIAAVALQVPKLLVILTGTFPAMDMPVMADPPSVFVTLAGMFALGGAYVAFQVIDTYLRSLRLAAENSDAPYRSLMDTAPIPFVVVVDDAIVYLNAACAVLLGTTVEDALGTSLGDRVEADSQGEYQRVGKRVLRKLRAVDRVSLTLVAEDGAHRLVELSANPVDHGDQLALQMMMYDRTAQFAAESELRQTRVDYQQFFERIPVALYRSRPDGRIAHVNQAAVELLGASDPSEIIGTNASDYYVKSDDREQLATMLGDDGVVAGYEWQMRRKDGGLRWIRDTSRLIETAHGRYFEGAMVDVTARRNIEQELWSRAVQQEAAAAVGQLALETEDIVAMCETLADVVLEVLGATSVAVMRRGPTGLFELIGTQTNLEPVSLSGIADRAHMSAAPVILRSANEVRFAAPKVHDAGYKSCIALMVPGKEFEFGTLLVLSDTERVYSTDDLNFLYSVTNVLAAAVDRASAYERLEALVASKDAFVASVSHELRTPLTVVSGLAHELSNRWRSLSESEMEEFMSMMVGQSLDMADLIEDLLVAARSNIGNVGVRIDPVDVEPQVTDVLAGFGPHTTKTIVADIKPGVVEADGVRFRQILRNLISNAIKYGGPKIEVRGATHSGVYIIEVRDTGDAIPLVDRERIFEPYERAHDSTGRPGSVGLGLAVSRTLAELMRGSLTYRHDGESVFRLELPAEGSLDDTPDSMLGENEVIRSFGAVGTSRIGVDIGSI